jgi:hypothetical protein
MLKEPLSLDDVVEEPLLNEDLEGQLRIDEIVMEDIRAMRKKGRRRETPTATGKPSTCTPTRTDDGNQASLPAVKLEATVFPRLSIQS